MTLISFVHFQGGIRPLCQEREISRKVAAFLSRAAPGLVRAARLGTLGRRLTTLDRMRTLGVTQKCGAEKASLRKAVKGSGLETEWGRGREWRPCQRPHRETNAVQHVSSGAR